MFQVFRRQVGRPVRSQYINFGVKKLSMRPFDWFNNEASQVIQDVVTIINHLLKSLENRSVGS